MDKRLLFESKLAFRPYHYFEFHNMFFLLSDNRAQMLCFSDMYHFQLASIIVSPRIYQVSQENQNLSTWFANLNHSWNKEAFLIEDNFNSYIVLASDLLILDRDQVSYPSLDELISTKWRYVSR